MDRRRVARRRVRRGGERGGRELELARVDVELRRPSLGDELKGRRVLLPQHPRRRRRAVVHLEAGARRRAQRRRLALALLLPPPHVRRRHVGGEVLLARRARPLGRHRRLVPRHDDGSEGHLLLDLLRLVQLHRRLALRRRDDRRVEELELRQRVDDRRAVVVLVGERVPREVEVREEGEPLQHLERRLEVLQQIVLELEQLEVVELREAARRVRDRREPVVVEIQLLEAKVVFEPLELRQLVVVEPQHLEVHEPEHLVGLEPRHAGICAEELGELLAVPLMHAARDEVVGLEGDHDRHVLSALEVLRGAVLRASVSAKSEELTLSCREIGLISTSPNADAAPARREQFVTHRRSFRCV